MSFYFLFKKGIVLENGDFFGEIIDRHRMVFKKMKTDNSIHRNPNMRGKIDAFIQNNKHGMVEIFEIFANIDDVVIRTQSFDVSAFSQTGKFHFFDVIKINFLAIEAEKNRFVHAGIQQKSKINSINIKRNKY